MIKNREQYFPDMIRKGFFDIQSFRYINADTTKLLGHPAYWQALMWLKGTWISMFVSFKISAFKNNSYYKPWCGSESIKSVSNMQTYVISLAHTVSEVFLYVSCWTKGDIIRF